MYSFQYSFLTFQSFLSVLSVQSFGKSFVGFQYCYHSFRSSQCSFLSFLSSQWSFLSFQ